MSAAPGRDLMCRREQGAPGGPWQWEASLQLLTALPLLDVGIDRTGERKLWEPALCNVSFNNCHL